MDIKKFICGNFCKQSQRHEQLETRDLLEINLSHFSNPPT